MGSSARLLSHFLLFLFLASSVCSALSQELSDSSARLGPYAIIRNLTLSARAVSIGSSSATPGRLYWLQRSKPLGHLIHVVDTETGHELPSIDVEQSVAGRGYPAVMEIDVLRSDAAGHLYVLVSQRGGPDGGCSILGLHVNGSFYTEVNTRTISVMQSYDVSPDGALFFLYWDYSMSRVFDSALNQLWTFYVSSETATQWSTAVFLPALPDSNLSSAGRVAFLNNTATMDGCDAFSLLVYGWANDSEPYFTLLESRAGAAVPNPPGWQGMLNFRSFILARDGRWVMAGGYSLGPNPLCFFSELKGGGEWQCVHSVSWGPSVLTQDSDGNLLVLLGNDTTVSMLAVPVVNNGSLLSSSSSSSSTAPPASSSSSFSSSSISSSSSSSPCPSCRPCNCSVVAPSTESGSGVSVTVLVVVAVLCLLLGMLMTAVAQWAWLRRSQLEKSVTKPRAALTRDVDTLHSPMLNHTLGDSRFK